MRPRSRLPKWFRARDRWSMSRFRSRSRSRSELFSAALSCSVSRSSFSRPLLSLRSLWANLLTELAVPALLLARQ